MDDDRFSNLWADRVAYRLCPACFRAVPVRSPERYCINDGTWLLQTCPICETPITSPYARFCGECGFGFAWVAVGDLEGGIR